MTIDMFSRSLDRLTATIAPPQRPLGLGRSVVPEDRPPFPPDLLRFVDSYGSGFFNDGSVFLSVLNPYEDDYWAEQNRYLELYRDYKKWEGDEVIPYGVYPDEPGLLLWGFGQGRKDFFWLTQGEPSSWPVIVMYDVDVRTRFDTPTVVFLEGLMCGDIDCSFIGGVDTPGNRIDPRVFRFEARMSSVG